MVRSDDDGLGERMANKSRNARSSKGANARGETAKPADVEGVEDVDLESDAAARSALSASDKLYYRIGEVSRLTSVKAHVLRYWETEFRWMAPPKSRSKQRLYRKRDIEFVWLLKRLLWEERYTIAGARQRIQELGVDNALALLDRSPDESAPAAVSLGALAETVPTATSETQPSGADRAAWRSFRAALDEMQEELVALRGVLQEGA